MSKNNRNNNNNNSLTPIPAFLPFISSSSFSQSTLLITCHIFCLLTFSAFFLALYVCMCVSTYIYTFIPPHTSHSQQALHIHIPRLLLLPPSQLMAAYASNVRGNDRNKVTKKKEKNWARFEIKVRKVLMNYRLAEIKMR